MVATPALVSPGYAGIADILDAQKVVQIEDVLHFDTELTMLAPWQMYDSRIGQTRQVDAMEFLWLTDDVAPYSVLLDQNYDGVSLVFSVATGYGKYFTPATVILGSNNVQYLVSSISYNDSASGHDLITVTKVDAAADAAMTTAAGGKLFILPSAITDKASASTGFHDNPTPHTSYCQNFIAAVSMTDIAEKTALYGVKSPLEADHRKRQFEIVRMRELSRLYSKGYKNASSGTTTWIADGIRPQFATNVWDFGNAVITVDLINAKLPALLERQPIEGLALFAPPGFISKFSADALGKVLLNPDTTKWGMKVNQLVTYAGPLDVIPETLMRNFLGSSAAVGQEAFLVTLDECKKVTFADGGLKVLANKQNPSDFQNRLDIYTSRTGFQWGSEKRHALLTNFKYA